MMKLSRLSPAELDTMLTLWDCGEPIRPAALLEKVNRTHAWNISTLQTILARLEEKGMVVFTAEKRFRYFSPKISKEEYAAEETGSLLDRLTGYSPVRLMAGLIDAGHITESELDEIDALLRAARENLSRKNASPESGKGGLG